MQPPYQLAGSRRGEAAINNDSPRHASNAHAMGQLINTSHQSFQQSIKGLADWILDVTRTKVS